VTPVTRLLIAGSVAIASFACEGGGDPGAAGSDPASASRTGAEAPASAPLTADPDDPPGARPDLVAMLREDREATRHPADGGGRAWIEGEADARVGTPGRWTVVYEAGPEGVAEGGTVFLMTSPFWGWSTPQTVAPDRPGYTEVTTDAAGVELEARTVDAQLLAIGVGGRALGPGERIRIVLGAGEARAHPDRFREREERLWVGVDGDGDGVRAWVEDPPALDVAPGPPAILRLSGPSTARPGGVVRLSAAILDAEGNTGIAWEGTLELAAAEGLDCPEAVRLAPEHAGRATLSCTASAPGTFRVRGRAGELSAESNPVFVERDAERVLWADLHGHSQLSDGTGTPEDYYRYARDVAGLDVAALTDHDHWGVRSLDERPELWERIRAAADAFHAPERFVTLLGYEWTSWIHGHRHVLYFADDGAVHSSLDESTDDPRELWAALAEGPPALTFAHHSAGGPIPTNWAIPPDPRFEPVTEVTSVHGSSEALDAPGVIHSPVPGNFVRDVLEHGYRLGFVGSGDSHDGHPGLAHLATGQGGLAAILAEENTREAVLAALRARRTYATNGPRILLQATLADRPMGSTLETDALRGDAELRARVVAPGELDRVEVVGRGGVARRVPGDGRRELDLVLGVEHLEPGDFLYLRVVQVGGGAAWSSPFFVADTEGSAEGSE